MKAILLEMITCKTDFISRKQLRSFSTGFPYLFTVYNLHCFDNNLNLNSKMQHMSCYNFY